MTYLFFFLGLALLLVGANYLVDSSVAIAKRAHLSNFIIGLTIVGIGTSAPELFISITSALKGMGDVSVGNVLGSNICNTLLILGITAAIAPFAITRETLKRDIPFSIFVSVLLFVLCYDTLLQSSSNIISRIDGIILICIFGAFMCYTVRSQGATKEYEESSDSSLSGKPLWLAIVIAAVSLGALLGGGDMFLDSAVALARDWGMSESVISITIIAVGTSLPELITCVIAASKGNSQLALGNVIGSNIFNVLLILGISATLSPIRLANINLIDFSVLAVASVLVFIAAFTLRKRIIDRAEGIIFIALYIAYTVYLLMR